MEDLFVRWRNAFGPDAEWGEHTAVVVHRLVLFSEECDEFLQNALKQEHLIFGPWIPIFQVQNKTDIGIIVLVEKTLKTPEESTSDCAIL